MTDVLLAHGFFLTNDPRQLEKMRPYPPLGTLYAASHLRARGYRVALFDAMLAEGEQAFAALLAARRPRIVAFYEDTFHFLNKMCLGHVREATCRMAAAARAAGATVIAAGADVSDHPEVYFAHGVAYALVGEPDHSLVELVDVLSGRADGAPETVAGLVLPAAGDGGDETVRRTPARRPERRPDAFPFPAWDLVDVEAYRRAWRAAHGSFSLNMVTTRGCPFHCNWCAKPIWGQQYAMRSPENVAEEMARIKATLGPDHLWFADDIFGLQPRWVAAFADQVEARDAALPFTIQSRVDLMTEKAVAGLRRAGCVEVWMGVESGSQRILDAMDKGTSAAAVPAARERLRAAGIRACYFLQFGYPGETWDDIMKTVELVRRTLPDDIGISVSYPLPGTRFHDLVAAELAERDHWRDSQDLAMLFQGTYRTPFYRRLHRLLHEDLTCRQRWAAAAEDRTADDGAARQSERTSLAAAWQVLRDLEAGSRSDDPTAVTKTWPSPPAPDLRQPWS